VDNSNKNYYPKKEIKKLLNQLYDYAIKLEIVDKRLSKFVDCGSNDKESTRKPFTQNEIKILWDNVNKVEFVDSIILLIYTRFTYFRAFKHKDRERSFVREIYGTDGR